MAKVTKVRKIIFAVGATIILILSIAEFVYQLLFYAKLSQEKGMSLKKILFYALMLIYLYLIANIFVQKSRIVFFSVK